MYSQHCDTIPIHLLQQLLAETDINRTFETLTEFVERTIPSFKATLLMHDSEKNLLYQGSFPSFLSHLDEGLSFPIAPKASIAGQAAYWKKPIFCPDVRQQEQWQEYFDFYTRYNIRSVCSFPILSTKNDLLGVFCFCSAETFSEKPFETPFFETITSLAGVVLERYWNHRRTKSILAELQSSQERLNLALQSQKMGVWDWYIQPDRLILDDAVFAIFGMTRADAQGHLSDMKRKIHPDDIEPTIRALHRVFQKNTSFEHDFRILRNGEIRHLALIGYVVRDESGEPIRMTGLSWDITEKVLSNKKLEQERAKAVANSKMASLGEMASGIAHEINNPLTIILNRANQLKHRLQNQDFDKTWAELELVKIENTVERIAKIIRGLRAFSRNSDCDPMISCELNSIIEETLELCQEKFKRYGITFSLKGFENLISIKCRPAQISQVLLNLFNNSFDAIARSQEPWIELELIISNGRALLKVTDSGNGIPSHIAERMMDPFFSTKEVGRGTGLGLSISRGIMEEHSGRLWLDRDQNNTCFVVEIPIEEVTFSEVRQEFFVSLQEDRSELTSDSESEPENQPLLPGMISREIPLNQSHF